MYELSQYLNGQFDLGGLEGVDLLVKAVLANIVADTDPEGADPGIVQVMVGIKQVGINLRPESIEPVSGDPGIARVKGATSIGESRCRFVATVALETGLGLIVGIEEVPE